jgi:hypothetical protein
MTLPIRPSEASPIEVRQALQRIELNRRTAPLHNFTATADPDTAGSDADDETQGYSIGSFWFNTSTDQLFLCTDATAGAPVWPDVTTTIGGASKAFKTITPPDANDLVADGVADTLTITESGGCTITGISASDTLNIDAAGSSHNHDASDITTGLLALARGGTNADLSATGGAGQVLQQASVGAAITVGRLAVLRFFQGLFLESFNALAAVDGGAVKMTLTNAVSGNLTMNFSDGETTFDLSGSDGVVTLTHGNDNSPTKNFVYILKSDKILRVSTSDWPTAEHIRIGFFFVPSVAKVLAKGVFITHNMNDHVSEQTTDLGHWAHMAERIRAGSALYKTGSALTVTPSSGGTVVDVAVTSGLVYQFHPHITPAIDTATGGTVLVINQNGAAYDDVGDLETLTNDSAGVAVKKYFNWVFWGTANKAGEFAPLCLNLPNGSYNKLASAIADTSGFDVLTMPSAFNVESTTGYLLSRVTMSLSGGVFAVEAVVDLRGSTPQSVTGGVGGQETEFPDNLFGLFDDLDATKELVFQLSSISTATTRTITMADRNIDLGDMVAGPGSATDNAIARFDGTTGKIVQNSLVTIDDTTPSMTFTASASIKASGGSNLSIVPEGNLELGTVSTDLIKIGRTSGAIDVIIQGTGASSTKLLFRDSGLYINSSADGTLDIVADTILAITAPLTTLSGHLSLVDDKELRLGDAADDAKFVFADSNLILGIGLGGGRGHFALMEHSAIGHANRLPGNASLPTLQIYADGTVSALDVISISHNKTDGIINVGSGQLKLTGLTALEVEGDIILSGDVDGVDIAAHAADADAHHNKLHDLLGSADHGDTVTGSPVRGDLIHANGTPAWAKFGISGTADTYLGSDGTDSSWTALEIKKDTTPELGGEMDAGAHTIGFTQQTVTYSSGTTTVDWKLSNKAKLTFGAGNITTLAFTNPTNPCNVLLEIKQDGVGSRVVTAWDADILFPGGTDPTLSTGANDIDVFAAYWDGTNYLAQVALDFS